jgi:carbon-monoxide dehydrogenase small subunit
MPAERDITLSVNGRMLSGRAEPRMTLADFLRERLGLTGTHLGCEHGVCGACTILIDGRSVRSCLLFAIQAEGHDLTTVEGLAGPDGTLHPIQEAFSAKHGLQCGFCTPGFLMSVHELLEDEPDPDEETIRTRLSGNLCRCTGYQNIVEAVRYASELIRSGGEAGRDG